ncbi:MAGE-domain-containing protein, partial [Eremomyces bilateralis CBS 781.70]
MPLVRKRRATRDDIDDDDVQTPRRRQLPDDSSDEDVTMVADDDASQPGGAADVTQMARKLVRLALACEYSRQPIRRAEISAKVLGNHPRQFKTVFEEAQGTLRDVFGMEMSELPVREKITLQEKRAAQRAPKGSLSSKSWVLTTVLPPRFRDPAIIPPPAVPTHDAESAYIGLYTFLISVIYLNGGSLAEAKLERYLRRANADEYTPVDRTDKLLQRMQREGYLVRVKDNSTGEEMV